MFDSPLMVVALISLGSAAFLTVIYAEVKLLHQGG